MAFNAALPANNSPVASAELRAQFTGLKDLVDERPTVAEVNDAILTQAAGSTAGMELLSILISDPPTQYEVQQVLDKLNSLIAVLNRAV